MINNSVGFIGGGRITRIFLGGFKRAGQSLRGITVSDANPDTLTELQKSFPEIIISPNDNTVPAACDIVFLAVHPPVMGTLLQEIRPSLQPQSLIVSLAPKFTIAKLVNALGGFERIARMIPNAASIVGAGYNPIAFGPALTAEDQGELIALLAPLGDSPVVPDANLEAYAIVTAMGPTYFWFQWSELKKLALGFGLNEADAEAGIKSMLNGAVKTMFESGLSEAEVNDLIPVKPLGEDEATVKMAFATKLPALYEKLTN